MKRFKFAFAVVAVVMTGIFLIGCDNAPGNNIDEPQVDNYHVKLVCFGDSLTAGYGAGGPGVEDREKSYPAYLQKKVNITVINKGVSGDTTAQGLARIDADVISEDPQIVIVELGANDFLQLTLLETTSDNLHSIISLLDNGNRKIYVAKFWTEAVAQGLAASHGIPSEALAPIIEYYDNMFNSLVSPNVELIEDIWAQVWGRFMSDNGHPNATGYSIMADNYFNALKPYLRANNWTLK